MCPRGRAASLRSLWQDIAGPSACDDPWGLTQAFQMLDRDGDGAIKGADLTSFFSSCIGQSISDSEVRSMIALADLDGDGAVQLEEFQHLMARGTAASDRKAAIAAESQAALREAFGVLDVDQDGLLTREDLKSAMAMSGQVLSDQEVDAMVAVASRLRVVPGSQTTSIDFHTFSKLMSVF